MKSRDVTYWSSVAIVMVGVIVVPYMWDDDKVPNPPTNLVVDPDPDPTVLPDSVPEAAPPPVFRIDNTLRTPAFTASYDTADMLVFSGRDGVSVSLNVTTGEIKHEGYTPDEAAVAFWRAVSVFTALRCEP